MTPPLPSSPRHRAFERLSPAERMALWAIRRSRYGATACTGLPDAERFPPERDAVARAPAPRSSPLFPRAIQTFGESATNHRALSDDPRPCLAALRAAGDQGQRARNRPPCLALPGSLLVTDDEFALLRAAAAAQAGAIETAEAFLVDLSPGPLARRSLVEALAALAAWLALAGHWLPAPVPPRLFPAASLAVVRLRGEALRGAEVTWPREIPRYPSSRATTARNQAMPQGIASSLKS